MKAKTMIFITIILTLLFAYGGLVLYNYGLTERQDAYEEGYATGLIYTQQTGNVVFLNDGIMSEATIEQVCSSLIQQQQGGSK